MKEISRRFVNKRRNNRRTKKPGRMLTVIGTALFLAIFMSGCGKQNVSIESSTATATEQEAGVMSEEKENREAFQSREQVDVLSLQWKTREPISDAPKLWKVESYIPNVAKEKGSDWKCYAQDGTDVYVLDIVTDADGEEQGFAYYLSHLDCDTFSTETVQINKGDIVTENRNLLSIDAAGGKIVAFLMGVNKKTKALEEYFAVFLGEDGTFGERVDLLPAFKEAGLDMESDLAYEKPYWDGRGYFYLRGNTDADIYVINQDGELLGSLTKGYSTGDYVYHVGNTAEGVCIWVKQDQTDRTLTYFYYEEDGMKTLFCSDTGFVCERFFSSRGDMIYVHQGAIVCWNLATGEYRRLYIGNASLEGPEVIVQNSDGKIVVLKQESDKVSANVYSVTGPTETAELSLLAISVLDYYTRNYVKEFERRHPGIKINLIEPEFGELDLYNLQTEMENGKGPDLILMPAECMWQFQENGLLADLTDVLPEEIKEQIYPGVLDYGKVDDRIYLLTYNADVDTLMVSKEIREDSTWNIQDILDLVEYREKSGNPIEAFHNTVESNEQNGQSAETILYTLTRDLENSSFLNLEKGECNFDCEDFRRLLRMCKKYGVPEAKRGNWEYLDADTWNRQRGYVQEGKALAYKSFNSSFAKFSEDMAAFGGDFSCIGYPTEGKSGSFWNCSAGLAVNDNTQYGEIIYELLRFLFSEECQIQDLNSRVVVRKDLLDEWIVEHGDGYMLRSNDGIYWSLDTKPDGSTYLEEYKTFLESAVPRRYRTATAEISTIISEEASAYFAGGKELDEVIDLIQRRAQLYLDENR